MLQYRLSTLFLIFFVVAMTMALFGAWGIWLAGFLFLAAICLNRAESLEKGLVLSFLIYFGIVCTGIMPPYIPSREAARRAACYANLSFLGLGLLNYHDSQHHFPSVYTCDKDGKPLFSWLVQVLPNTEYDSIYNHLKKDEPWDSPKNKLVLNQAPILELLCPSAAFNKNVLTTNYIAIIGPGTIWRNEGTVKLSDLPDGGSHTVMLVEVAESGVHWAEPFALTVDEVLENMKTGKGMRISSNHFRVVHILFANGRVRRIPVELSLSLWRRILAGGVKDKEYDDLELQTDSNAQGLGDGYLSALHPKPWIIILGVIVWLFSIGLLFHRAVKSRKKPEIEPNPLAS